MAQVFVFGSSSAHGVGGPDGGWGDILKIRLHQMMYGPGGTGEKHQIYNFAKPGAKIAFVERTVVSQLNDYRLPGKILAIVAVGGNNVKAEGAQDRYVSTLQDYAADMARLLKMIQGQVDAMIVLGFKAYDETKTMPKKNPLTGGISYFSNERTHLFHKELCKICDHEGYILIDMGDPQEWVQTCLSEDGLHPNEIGHLKIADQIWPHVQKFLDS